MVSLNFQWDSPLAFRLCIGMPSDDHLCSESMTDTGHMNPMYMFIIA